MDKMAYQAQFLQKRASSAEIFAELNQLFKALKTNPEEFAKAQEALMGALSNEGVKARQNIVSTLPYTLGGAGAGLVAGVPVGLIGGTGAGYGVGRLMRPSSDKAPAPIAKKADVASPTLEKFLQLVEKLPQGTLTNWMANHPWLLGSGVAGAAGLASGAGFGALGAGTGYLLS
jgi:hypothetical protein